MESTEYGNKIYHISCLSKKQLKTYFVIVDLNDKDFVNLIDFLHDNKIIVSRVNESQIEQHTTDPYLIELCPVKYFVNKKLDYVKKTLTKAFDLPVIPTPS